MVDREVFDRRLSRLESLLRDDRRHLLIAGAFVWPATPATIVGALAMPMRGLAPVRREIIDHVGRG